MSARSDTAGEAMSKDELERLTWISSHLTYTSAGLLELAGFLPEKVRELWMLRQALARIHSEVNKLLEKRKSELRERQEAEDVGGETLWGARYDDG